MAEGEHITLQCIMEGGKPGEVLYWKSGKELLKSGKPPILNYSFATKLTDDMKNYTCGVNSSDNTNPLAAHVQIDLIRKFVYFF